MLQIAHLQFSSSMVLAPLAGYTDLPFRLLCKRHGAGYCVSEMISCHGLVYRQKNTLDMLASHSEEQPVSFQLFGAEPDIMAEAATILEEYGPEMIDINMGCPVRKVTKRGAGAALMTTPECAEEIVRKVVSRVKVPVTVKFRAGKDSTHINAVSFAKMLEDAGASALIVHGRTWAQGFSGTIDPNVIAMVKAAVKLPVIGNGDVLSRADAESMMHNTGCDGVMVGRGALGNPWIFSKGERPDLMQEVIEGAKEHLTLMEEFLPAERMLGYIRNHISRYFHSLPGSSAIRREIYQTPDLNSLKDLLERCREGAQRTY